MESQSRLPPPGSQPLLPMSGADSSSVSPYAGNILDGLGTDSLPPPSALQKQLETPSAQLESTKTPPTGNEKQTKDLAMNVKSQFREKTFSSSEIRFVKSDEWIGDGTITKVSVLVRGFDNNGKVTWTTAAVVESEKGENISRTKIMDVFKEAGVFEKAETSFEKFSALIGSGLSSAAKFLSNAGSTVSDFFTKTIGSAIASLFKKSEVENPRELIQNYCQSNNRLQALQKYASTVSTTDEGVLPALNDIANLLKKSSSLSDDMLKKEIDEILVSHEKAPIFDRTETVLANRMQKWQENYKKIENDLGRDLPITTLNTYVNTLREILESVTEKLNEKTLNESTKSKLNLLKTKIGSLLNSEKLTAAAEETQVTARLKPKKAEPEPKTATWAADIKDRSSDVETQRLAKDTKAKVEAQPLSELSGQIKSKDFTAGFLVDLQNKLQEAENALSLRAASFIKGGTKDFFLKQFLTAMQEGGSDLEKVKENLKNKLRESCCKKEEIDTEIFDTITQDKGGIPVDWTLAPELQSLRNARADGSWKEGEERTITSTYIRNTPQANQEKSDLEILFDAIDTVFASDACKAAFNQIIP